MDSDTSKSVFQPGVSQSGNGQPADSENSFSKSMNDIDAASTDGVDSFWSDTNRIFTGGFSSSGPLGDPMSMWDDELEPIFGLSRAAQKSPTGFTSKSVRGPTQEEQEAFDSIMNANPHPNPFDEIMNADPQPTEQSHNDSGYSQEFSMQQPTNVARQNGDIIPVDGHGQFTWQDSVKEAGLSALDDPSIIYRHDPRTIGGHDFSGIFRPDTPFTAHTKQIEADVDKSFERLSPLFTGGIPDFDFEQLLRDADFMNALELAPPNSNTDPPAEPTNTKAQPENIPNLSLPSADSRQSFPVIKPNTQPTPEQMNRMAEELERIAAARGFDERQRADLYQFAQHRLTMRNSTRHGLKSARRSSEILISADLDVVMGDFDDTPSKKRRTPPTPRREPIRTSLFTHQRGGSSHRLEDSPDVTDKKAGKRPEVIPGSESPSATDPSDSDFDSSAKTPIPTTDTAEKRGPSPSFTPKRNAKKAKETPEDTKPSDGSPGPSASSNSAATIKNAKGKGKEKIEETGPAPVNPAVAELKGAAAARRPAVRGVQRRCAKCKASQSKCDPSHQGAVPLP